MPIYEYRCQECEHEFEVLVRSSKSSSVCPACESEALEKKVSGGGFILKGGGWYADGYQSGKRGGSDE